MSETVATFPSQIAGINGERQAVVLVLLAHREDENGRILELTASQKEAARNAAQAALEITPGTEVLGTSTALLLPNVELEEGETLTLTLDASVVRSTVEESAPEAETETVETNEEKGTPEPPAAE